MPAHVIGIMRMLGLMLGVLCVINVVLNAMADSSGPDGHLMLGIGIGIGTLYQWLTSIDRKRHPEHQNSGVNKG